MRRYYSEKPYHLTDEKKRREEWENGRIDPWYSTECRKGEWISDFLRDGLMFLLQLTIPCIIVAAIISAIAMSIPTSWFGP